MSISHRRPLAVVTGTKLNHIPDLLSLLCVTLDSNALEWLVNIITFLYRTYDLITTSYSYWKCTLFISIGNCYLNVGHACYTQLPVKILQLMSSDIHKRDITSPSSNTKQTANKIHYHGLKFTQTSLDIILFLVRNKYPSKTSYLLLELSLD